MNNRYFAPFKLDIYDIDLRIQIFANQQIISKSTPKLNASFNDLQQLPCWVLSYTYIMKRWYICMNEFIILANFTVFQSSNSELTVWNITMLILFILTYKIRCKSTIRLMFENERKNGYFITIFLLLSIFDFELYNNMIHF